MQCILHEERGIVVKADYQMCSKCIMDTECQDIEFDESGVCNYCKEYDERVKKYVLTGKEGTEKLNRLFNEIKEKGKDQKYDSIIGLSGGVDSSYVAYMAKKAGLRPLAVSVDNGYDTEIARSNVKNIVRELDIDLHIYVIDREEFKDLQLAYLKASVMGVEIPTDHAIPAVMNDTACRNGIKYYLDGNNVITEAVLPKTWTYRKNDLQNLKAIHKVYGKVKLKTYPTMGLLKGLYYRFIKGIQSVFILNYIHYNIIKAKKILQNELDWKDYGGKHHESIFTRFYQLYFLPKKFNIDKRRIHLSALICSGQITREEALREAEKPLYDEDKLKKDKEYVLKKLGLSEKEFEHLMNLPVRKHREFKSDEQVFLSVAKLKSLYRAVSGRGRK